MLTIRQGTLVDVERMVRLRRLMFEAMGCMETDDLDAMCSQTRAFLTETVPTGVFRFWMAHAEDSAIGAIGMVLHRVPPTPENLRGKEAYLMNLVVLPEHRRRGVGRALLLHALTVARGEGIPVASLHASRAGRALYQDVGFELSSDLPEMRIDLRD